MRQNPNDRSLRQRLKGVVQMLRLRVYPQV
ncbi:hypothetical protein PS903_00897 [Pseudomonas fluorescens]|nr:hypothetical protein PS903_00897 [Pseudomonas fluorescens]